MCSIFGYYKLNNRAVHKDFVQTAFSLMRHRGPDHEHFEEIDERVGLGHQRLAIIDLCSDANQPMHLNECYIAYNGELYNYIELKEGLKDLNLHFMTSSDTEVLLNGLVQEGVRFLNKCNGMFAFAFYDKSTKKLILGRDRFGVKPLHYMIQDNILYYSSEIKPLIKIKHSLEKNLRIYDSFIRDLATDYDEETFIEGIFQLKKGHYLICSDNSVKTYQWYYGGDFSFDRKIFADDKDVSEFTEDLLCDAIAKRLRADVPVCITLSGGLDSTTIYTVIKERLKKDIQPFTFIHPGSGTDEQEKVNKLVRPYDEKLLCVQSNYQQGYKQVEEALHYLEFPIWNLSAIAYMDMYRTIREHRFRVVVEGHGSDEQLGGYPTVIRSAVFEYLRKFKLRKAFNIYKVLGETANADIGGKNSILRMGGAFIRNAVLNKKLDVSFGRSVMDVFDYRILPIVLRTFDRITMRSSVESRSPFMDYRLVEFFKQMPLKYKVSELGSKVMLRQILRKYNKDYIYKDKKKMGFAYDLPAFFTSQKNRDYMRERILAFDMDGYSGLKERALSDVTKKHIGWRDTEAIWKIASLSVVNSMYGL
jgi:asparagine synthase (glutamine-hydrolysing)